MYLFKLTCVFKLLVCMCHDLPKKKILVYGDPKVGCFFALQNRGLVVRVIVLVSLLQQRLHSVPLFVQFNIHIIMLYLPYNDLLN